MTPERWQKVSEILQQAWEKRGEERAAFIEQACAHDVELRARVEALLVIDENVGEFLAAPAISILDHSAAGRDDFTQRERDQHFGPYQIVREIGHGGMGTVYLAERADGQYSKRVAIKVVNAQCATADLLRRFRNERQLLATLDHPNIARLLDGGATVDGLPYIVMEYVEGIRVDTWCDGRQLSLRDLLAIFQKVCSAVQYAHERQVVHRDIKPGNILVTADGTPKLLDFGIAKIIRPELSWELFEPTTGRGPLTPEYASPEQIRGDVVGPASDVYALGLVLYRLLTGRPAHSAGRDSGSQSQDAAPDRQHELLKPSIAGRNAKLTADLDSIVLKAIRKQPERRYASVQQFSGDIECFLRDLPVRARKESLPYRARKFLKRNRVATTTAALTAALVLAIVAGLGRFIRPSAGTDAGIRSIAVLPLENLSHDPQQEPFVDGMTDGLIGDLGQIKSLRVIARDSVMRYKGANKPPALTARELNANVLVEGSVLLSGDRVRVSVQVRTGTMERLLWTQTYDRELQHAQALQSDAAKGIARQIQIQLTPQEEVRLSPTHVVNRQAYEAYFKGRYQSYKYTDEGFEKGIQYFKQAVEIDPGDALAWAGLADGYYNVSDQALPPRDAIPLARAAVLRALALDENLAEAHASFAMIESQYDWDWAAAEKSFRRALELNPSYAIGHRYYSFYLAQLARFEQAIAEAAEAYRLDPLPPIMGTNLGWTYYLARRPDQAIAQFRKTLAVDASAAVTHYSLGLTYEQKGMFEQAIAEFRTAQAIDKDCCLNYLGHVYAVSGKREQASRTLEKLLELSRQRHIDPCAIAAIYVGLGELDKAFEWLERAYKARSEWLLLLKVEPVYDPLRSDPRYQGLLRRIGLPL